MAALAGKVVIVTGASRGIGRAIAVNVIHFAFLIIYRPIRFS
ncbi:hypothetical protein [Nostoc sp.]